MPTKEAIENMSRWLALTGADARLTSLELRDISNKAVLVVAKELGSEFDEQQEAVEYLRRHSEVLGAVERFRATSEALASYREPALQDDEEDRRLEQERIDARTALVSALEKATGRTFR